MDRSRFRESMLVQGNGFFSKGLVGGIGLSLLLHGGLGLLLIIFWSALKEELKPKERQFEAIEVVLWEGDRPAPTPIPQASPVQQQVVKSQPKQPTASPTPQNSPKSNVRPTPKTETTRRSPQPSLATPSPNPAPSPASIPVPSPVPAPNPSSTPASNSTPSPSPSPTPSSSPVPASPPTSALTPAAPTPKPPAPAPPPKPPAPAPKPAPAPAPVPSSINCVQGCGDRRDNLGGQSGSAVVRVEIGPSGSVVAASIVSSSGSGSLDSKAIAAARQMQFNAHNSGSNQFRQVRINLKS